MRVLGIDPGLNITGYACLESGHDPQPSVVEAGVLRFPRTSLSRRLGQLFGDLSSLIEELQPQCMAVEQVFTHARHVRTSILMGHARGVVLLAGERCGLELVELAATEVKKAVTGHGHASKHQMQHAVMVQCGLQELPEPPDVADAIAIAMCAARRDAAASVVSSADEGK